MPTPTLRLELPASVNTFHSSPSLQEGVRRGERQSVRHSCLLPAAQPVEDEWLQLSAQTSESKDTPQRDTSYRKTLKLTQQVLV